jgi:hypothetical protein
MGKSKETAPSGGWGLRVGPRRSYLRSFLTARCAYSAALDCILFCGNSPRMT